MNILRAQSTTYKDGWWELKLLDLRITADGETEQAMIADLAHRLCAEYHLAVEHGRTPFVDLVCGCPAQTDRDWQSDNKKFRGLNLPDVVSQSLATALRSPTLNRFEVVDCATAA